MDLISRLLVTYDECVKEISIGEHEIGDTQLLPIYHTNLKSTGNNIIQVTLNEDGTLFRADFIPKDETIVFPVTRDSMARSGRIPPSHPLVDKICYLSTINSTLHQLYRKEFKEWYQWVEDDIVKNFLKHINNFIETSDFLSQILMSLFGENAYQLKGFDLEYSYINSKGKKKTQKMDLSQVFITFIVNDYIGYRNVSVTDFTELQESYISFINNQTVNRGVCNVSGETQELTSKHRGLLGNAKLISVSNNKETYIGRFTKGSDIIQIGYQTSEKIHLMLKYLLENNNSNRWLGDQQYLVNWFSDDITNKSQLNLVSPTNPFAGFKEKEDNTSGQKIILTLNEKIGSSFIKGSRQFEDDANYYAAIIDKASNGRITVKYFRELKASELMRRLDKWEQDYSWDKFNVKTALFEATTPTLNQILLAAYGIERDGALILDNDQFKKDQFQKMVTSLIDGKKAPGNITKALSQNIRKRSNYKQNWEQIEFVALAMLRNIKGEGLQPVLDKNNNNRSYLFGRLLAVLELIEAATYNREDKRITNAQKYWTTYTNRPAQMMSKLIEKVGYYEKLLMNSERGIYFKLEKEMCDIINQINQHHIGTKELNKPLDYHFIFGYYAEKQYIFTKTEKDESEAI